MRVLHCFTRSTIGIYQGHLGRNAEYVIRLADFMVEKLPADAKNYLLMPENILDILIEDPGTLIATASSPCQPVAPLTHCLSTRVQITQWYSLPQSFFDNIDLN